MTKKKYVVHKANIKDDDGNKVCHGDVVELSTKSAQHYSKLGFLRPYIEDEEEDAEPSETGRDAAEPGSPSIQTSATPKPLRSRL